MEIKVVHVVIFVFKLLIRCNRPKHLVISKNINLTLIIKVVGSLQKRILAGYPLQSLQTTRVKYNFRRNLSVASCIILN